MNIEPPYGASQFKHPHQIDPLSVNHHLTGMFEVHSDPSRDIRLDLTDAPIGLLRVPDQHPRFQKCIHVIALSLQRTQHVPRP